jgi:hypothetical protein
MMTKWDTIQADVADAYTYIDEEEAYNKALEEGLEIGSTDYDEDELSKSLALDWEAYE